MERVILVVTGFIGAGKSEASGYIKSLGIPMFRTGDVIRKEVLNRGLELNTRNSEMIARKFREERGMDVASRRVGEKIKKLGDSLVCVEGPRDMHEIEFLATLGRVVIIIVKAPIETRFERTGRRKGRHLEPKTRDARTFEEFKWRDSKERERGLDEVVSTGKYTKHIIDNTGTKDELRKKIDDIISSLRHSGKRLKHQRKH